VAGGAIEVLEVHPIIVTRNPYHVWAHHQVAAAIVVPAIGEEPTAAPVTAEDLETADAGLGLAVLRHECRTEDSRLDDGAAALVLGGEQRVVAVILLLRHAQAPARRAYGAGVDGLQWRVQQVDALQEERPFLREEERELVVGGGLEVIGFDLGEIRIEGPVHHRPGMRLPAQVAAEVAVVVAVGTVVTASGAMG